ncbi:hypothetical protein C1893_01945 [Pseudomonas sp. MPR-ANC1]|nr:hypothetical protein C1893_01945 [Pseudomonas sp. MPR-ANC1]
MSCFICGDEAQLSVRPDSEEYQCPKCGHYRISRTAIELYRLGLWKFDIYLARRWIADQQDSDAIPFIDSDLAVRLLGA